MVGLWNRGDPGTDLTHFLGRLSWRHEEGISIDGLAVMVQRGFKETAKQVDVDKRFDAVAERLNHIEKLILADHKRRIERLEGEMKELRKLFAME